MNIKSGQVKQWDELTEEQKKSGDWVELNGELRRVRWNGRPLEEMEQRTFGRMKEAFARIKEKAKP